MVCGPGSDLGGSPPYRRVRTRASMAPMPTFLLCHAHDPRECRFAFAAWNGFESPLRHRPTIGSCAGGGHRLWWRVEAPDASAAVAQLPPFLAERAEAPPLGEVSIPG